MDGLLINSGLLKSNRWVCLTDSRGASFVFHIVLHKGQAEGRLFVGFVN